MFLLYKF